MSQQVSVLELSPVEVKSLLADRKIVLIDVREPAEYGAERIHGALLYPLSTFDPAYLPVDASQQVVFHCAGGMRSLTAATRKLGVGGVAAHMKGGINAWKAAGLATIKIDPATGQIIDGGVV